MRLVFLFYICGCKVKCKVLFMKKELVKIIIKVLIYALGLFGAYFGVTSMTSCTAHRSVITRGHGSIIAVDTIYVDHNGNYQIKVK